MAFKKYLSKCEGTVSTFELFIELWIFLPVLLWLWDSGRKAALTGDFSDFLGLNVSKSGLSGSKFWSLEEVRLNFPTSRKCFR